MCDQVVSLAREQLLPLARDHLLPVLKEAANMIRGVPKGVAEMKGDLESIEDFINDAVRMAEAEEDHTRDGIKTRVKQLREASFLIEDVIDEYSICEGHRPRDPGCATIPRDTAGFIKTMMLRLQIAYKIQNIKSEVDGMVKGSDKSGIQIQISSEQGQNSSSGIQNLTLNNLQPDPLKDEAEVVGFEAPRDELIRWLVEGEEAKRTVISVVGQGGQGKTTLAKKVYDTKEVIEHFRCHATITVSKSYNVDSLLRDMLQQFCNESNKDPPQAMEGEPLRAEVTKHLQDKRYLILFDNVWDINFWKVIEYALKDNKKGSRILITTRNMDVAMSCKRSSLVLVHQLQPLSRIKSLELFYKKAFFEFDGDCPKNLLDVSAKIVEKCDDLPLAIVAIGGLLSGKDRDPFQWERFNETLSFELEKNPDLSVITKILGLSYHDLPYYLKWCFLYFGIYPEDYEIKADRLIRQWVAEGFVKDEKVKTVEETAETYLTDLIHRSLVQVTSLASDGKTRSCRVHDLVRQMILDKIQDLSFCHFPSSENEKKPVFDGMVRRLTIASSCNNGMGSVETSNIRSLHIFKNEELPDSYVTSIPSRHRLLKVLDLEDVSLYHQVPKNLGDLFLLRYLSFRNTKVENLPGSIGMLLNLETLDLRQTLVRELPREINMLTKLRHLLAYDISKGVGYGIQLKNGIGDIESLQTLREVEADHGGIELIKELERLTELRMLGLTNVKGEYTSALCSSINNKQHLEKLYITAVNGKEVIDLHHHVSAPRLRKLRLTGRLNNFPHWVRNLNLLVKLSLSHSMLTHDPLESLKDLTNLQYLSILYHAYDGETLHFPDGGFRSLKQLVLRRLYNLNSISIGEGALCSLERLKLVNISELYEVPSDVYDLKKLQVFHIVNMPEFEQNIDRDIGKFQWIIEQVPFVSIAERTWA
ncbi:disease resistance protein RPM1-like [Lotus japonicus]|uniref:disease resistance protein RPM1-like n=1 Tax=Lotus japonicus TaxID=34305 RepID=UPI00258ADF76|nr:disease resistance protein RPM1-like [Lotus japonicus]